MKTNVNDLMENMRNVPFEEAIESEKELKQDSNWHEWLLNENNNNSKNDFFL